MDLTKDGSLRPSDTSPGQWDPDESQDEITLAGFEWSMLRFASAFERCVLQIANAAGEQNLSVQEVLFLYLVSLQNSPQTCASLAHQLNREDVTNIQYIMRKLAGRGLVQKAREPKTKNYTFTLTKQGYGFTQRYSNIKKSLLVNRLNRLHDTGAALTNVRTLVNELASVYDEVARESPML